ncbi:hypothetical protein KI387_036927, partial [Taxus chinensis]
IRDLESKVETVTESKSTLETPLSENQTISSMNNAQVVEGNTDMIKVVAVPVGTNANKENTPPLTSPPTVETPS